MDVIRRNTDYALRMMVSLARHYGDKPTSSRLLSKEDSVPYQLASKLLQKLNRAKLVESQMGPKGGFRLMKKPSEITLGQIVVAIQGPISINRCLLDKEACEREPNCPVSKKLVQLQDNVDVFFNDITLNKLIQDDNIKSKKHQKG